MATLNELNRRANALKAAGRIDEALAAFRAIVELAPGNPIVLHNLAAALGDAGRSKEAVEWSARAFDAGIDAPEAWLVLGRGLAAEGRCAEARSALAEALRRRPTDPIVHRDLAQLRWMESGDRRCALESLDSAIASHPQAVELRLVRAQVLGHTGDAEGEYAETLEALRIGGGRQPQLLMAAANAALAAGASAAGVGHARAAADAMPTDGNIAYALCRALLADGDPLQAAAIASRLRAQFPLDQSYIAIQATAWRLLGDARYPAIYDYERLVAGFPLACPPGWASAERYVDDLIEALDRHHHFKEHPFGQSVRHGSQLPSIDKIDEPALSAVGAAIDGPVRAYLAAVGSGGDPLRGRNGGGHHLFGVWSVRLASSGHHVNHVHPQGWLSSACHLRFASPSGAGDRSGWLTFGEPGVPTRPALAAEHLVRPQKGVMVVFPSYMWHGTVPFEGTTTRLSIAADSLPGQPAR